MYYSSFLCIYLTCLGCVSWFQALEAPSGAQRSLEKMPEWCLAGGAHAGTSTELGSAWLPVHSGATPSAAKGGLPDKKEIILVKFDYDLQVVIFIEHIEPIYK